MTSYTVSGFTVHILLNEPSWASPVDASFELSTNVERGLEGAEYREPINSRVRTTFRYEFFLTNREASSLRNELQSMANDFVAVPFWPIKKTLAEFVTPPFDPSRYWILLGNGTVPVPTLLPHSYHGTYDESSPVYPLMVGRFTEPPEIHPLTDEVCRVRISFREQQPDASVVSYWPWLRFASDSDFLLGPAIASGATPPVFPISQAWTEQESGAASVEILREQIGDSLEETESYYTNPACRKISAEYKSTASHDWLAVLQLFAESGGQLNPVWVPAMLSDARITADIGASDTSISIDSASLLGSNRHYLVTDNINRAWIVATAAASPLPISSPTGISFQASHTRLESLVLCRFAEPKIELRWVNPDVCEFSINWREVPKELSAQSGETSGTTIGPTSQKVWLYNITVQSPSPTEYNFTSAESNVSFSPKTWTARQITHDDIRDTLNLERTSVNLRCKYWSGNPLFVFTPISTEWKLWCKIIEATVNASMQVTSLTTMFQGEIEPVSVDGQVGVFHVLGFGRSMDRKVPRFMVGQSCNHSVYDSLCGVSKASFTTSAKVAFSATNSNTVQIKSTGTAWTGSTFADHYFAGGLLEWGSGSTKETRLIVDSTVADGSGVVTLTLGFPVTLLVFDTVCSVCPGCDGYYSTCSSRFSNSGRFGGFPYIPTGNPSMFHVTADTGKVGKK